MVFKVKNKRISEVDKEINVLKRNPSVIGYYRTGSRVAFQVPQQIHKIGHLIKYKGEDYIIKRNTEKGIYVSPFIQDNQGFIKTEKNEKFISEKELHEGKVYPYYPLIWLGAV